MRSIERTLLAWILGALSLGALLITLAIYLLMLQEMGEVFDTDLRNVALSLAAYQRAGQPPPVASAASGAEATEAAETAVEAGIVTLSWTLDGRRLYASDAAVALPFSAVEGFSRPAVGTEQWVVYTHVQRQGIVQAAQRVASRMAIAAGSAAKLVPVMVVLMVAAGGLLVYGLRRGLRPLDVAAAGVSARDADALDPIATADVPREILPLVSAINGLIARLSAALASQRRFVADAAHELRTPIAALRLQLQWLQRSGDSDTRDEALRDLEGGIARSQRLVEQLLRFARAEPDGQALTLAPVDLAEVARSTVGRFSLKAAHAGIDLGAQAPGANVIQGDEQQLTVLLDNLIENALRYTLAGGAVDVAVLVEDGRTQLRVTDDGPGIPIDEREQVFERFHRGQSAQAQSRDGGGSGLGLAIVRAIAERHAARVSLRTAPSGRGLEVRVEFTLPAA